MHVDAPCRQCGRAGGVDLERILTGGRAQPRYRCALCGASWEAPADESVRAHSRSLTRERAHATERRKSDRRVKERRNAGDATDVTRAEHDNLMRAVAENAAAIRRMEASIRRIADHLNIDVTGGARRPSERLPKS